MPTKILDSDIARLYVPNGTRKQLLATLFWGDTIEVSDKLQDHYVVPITRYEWDQVGKRYNPKQYKAELSLKATFRDQPLLKVRVLDVGQGDSSIILTPDGKTVLMDGGKGDELRHYINVSYSHILDKDPLNCDAIIVTHGDADHYVGLTGLLNDTRPGGGPLVTADWVFHNGLVKGPGAEVAGIFGQTTVQDGITYVTDLVDDLRTAKDERMNQPFLAWKKALVKLKTATGGEPKMNRLQYGSDAQLQFLGNSDLQFRVFGPIVEKINEEPALRFLTEPGTRSLSAAQTINGHSVVLKMRYKNVRFLFGADLNEQSEERLVGKRPGITS